MSILVLSPSWDGWMDPMHLFHGFWNPGFGMKGWRACLYTNSILERGYGVDSRYNNRMNDTISFSPVLLSVREGKVTYRLDQGCMNSR